MKTFSNVARALVAGLVATAVAGAAAPAFAQHGDGRPARAARASAYRSLGTAVPLRKDVLIDASRDGVVAVTAHTPGRPESPVGRLLPSGRWERVKAVTGNPAAIQVSPKGATTVVGVVNRRVVATHWPRRADTPHTRTIMRFPACDEAECHRISVASNDDGELAVMAEFDSAGLDESGLRTPTVSVLRHRVGQPWSRPAAYPPNFRLGGMRAIDIDSRGRVWGAFEHDQTLQTRRLFLDHARLGKPRLVSKRYEAGADATHVAMSIGANGDRAFTWSFTFVTISAVYEDGTLTVLPSGGGRWQQTFRRTDSQTFPSEGQPVQTAPSGAATFNYASQSIRRWSPVTGDLLARRMPIPDPTAEKEAPVFSSHGAALVGTQAWLLGSPPSSKVKLPAGKVQAMAVSDAGVGYLAMRPVVDGKPAGIVKVYAHRF